MQKTILLILVIILVSLIVASNSFADEYVGPGLSYNDNNANIYITSNRYVAYAFSAEESSNLTSFVTLFRDGAGYSAGTCGTMRIRIWPSDGGAPARADRSGTPLSEGSHTFSCTNGVLPTVGHRYPKIAMTPNRPLVAGNLYFAEITNTDPSPNSNYISINAMIAVNPHVTVMRYVDPVEDWSLQCWNSGSWYDPSFVKYGWLNPSWYKFPAAEYGYANGEYQGYFYMENGNANYYYYTLTSSNSSRERFNIQNSRLIKGVEIHTSASVAGSMSIEFIKNDVTQVTKTITENPATFTHVPPNNNGVYQWYTINLDPGEYISVTQGDVLDIEMTPQGSSIWHMSAERTGRGSGHIPDTTISDEGWYEYSSAQWWTGSRWVNTLYYNKTCSSCVFATSHFRVILQIASNADSVPPDPPTGLLIVADN